MRSECEVNGWRVLVVVMKQGDIEIEKRKGISFVTAAFYGPKLKKARRSSRLK